jgi:lambda repressor-like predicted transcriptional regulator
MARPIKELNHKHRRVAQLRAQGLTHPEIAEQTGFSPSHVKTILATPEVKDMVTAESIRDSALKTMKTVEEVLDRAKVSAILLLEQVINDSDLLGDNAPTTKQRLDAAIELLGIAGYSKTQRVDHQHSHLLQHTDLAEIRSRAMLPPMVHVIDVEAL